MIDPRWAALAALLIGCTGGDGGRPELAGPYPCGPSMCASGQICVTESSGSLCQVDPDAGIGPYQTYSWTCLDVPAACDGVPSCSCVAGSGLCFGVTGGGREVSFGCI